MCSTLNHNPKDVVQLDTSRNATTTVTSFATSTKCSTQGLDFNTGDIRVVTTSSPTMTASTVVPAPEGSLLVSSSLPMVATPIPVPVRVMFPSTIAPMTAATIEHIAAVMNLGDPLTTDLIVASTAGSTAQFLQVTVQKIGAHQEFDEMPGKTGMPASKGTCHGGLVKWMPRVLIPVRWVPRSKHCSSPSTLSPPMPMPPLDRSGAVREYPPPPWPSSPLLTSTSSATPAVTNTQPATASCVTGCRPLVLAGTHDYDVITAPSYVTSGME